MAAAVDMAVVALVEVDMAVVDLVAAEVVMEVIFHIFHNPSKFPEMFLI